MENMEKKESIYEIAKVNFNKWNNALQTKDPKIVAGLYTDDNSFLPTLSSEFKSGIDGAESYFEHFLQKNPFGKIIEEKVQPIGSVGSDSYVHSGLYDFEVGQDQDRKTVEARFTYVWEKVGGEWKILHHHSSIKPQA